MVQTTFTRQKQELAKINQRLERLRAHEVRAIKYSVAKEKQNETRETYVDYSPEEVVSAVLNIVVQKINSTKVKTKPIVITKYLT